MKGSRGRSYIFWTNEMLEEPSLGVEKQNPSLRSPNAVLESLALSLLSQWVLFRNGGGLLSPTPRYFPDANAPFPAQSL